MSEDKTKNVVADDDDDLGVSKLPLCREPWESYYILRRGVLLCPYGNPISPMAEYAEAWNSPQLQEIRSFLSRGRLSSYCRENLSCPIVQRILQKEKEAGEAAGYLHISSRRPLIVRLLNRALFGLPKRIWRRIKPQ